MRAALRRFAVWNLGLAARATLRKYQPKIVAVTGSVGKTTTKDLIAASVASHYRSRAATDSYNSEFGVPLTVIGESAAGSAGGWLKILGRAWQRVLSHQDYPELLVLEMAADHPGDIGYLSRLAPPDVAVVTNVRNVHLMNYESQEAIAEEKSGLVKNLKPNGVAILNFDDTPVRMMRALAPAGVIYYGMTDESNVWISDVATTTHGVTGTLNVAEIDGTTPQKWLVKTQLLGKHQLYAVTAAVATGLALGISVPDTLAAVADFTPSAGRGRLLRGRSGLLIIDDSYNASPQAMIDSLAALKTLPGPRYAVLGDMAELGEATVESHRRIGEYVADWLDNLIVMGEDAGLIADAAIEGGMRIERVVRASNVREAAAAVDPDKKGGTVLVKASQANMYLERVVERLLEDPRDKSLLVQRRHDPKHHAKLAKYA